ncbi:hypothetical protein [Mycobacteroides abscessus]|uniref:hypothetical protein n=1 Tax=Mycobacteroides abscessus TaxID=36809 RepID=UPI000928D0BA|nr:hypothetical protein [Mycobacteroides abscessus]QSN49843.1 hypothetical protein I3U33_27365 [Mycobacteroides abscessus subsp. abscessus]SII80811.1 Uncharacterised protein [Mycobacteroides abscessus subsp. abscessus]SIK60045.1 Uncharacterised protein [Mycobacteroides abscessus subsp. abscessus]SIL81947.1 Uncharacterised protein [Mycobacteroides abscessus subsp. abscessus]SIM15399.1 Uncharacterised protein [Mycobacteroides abscessus subsp. abscessus]
MAEVLCCAPKLTDEMLAGIRSRVRDVVYEADSDRLIIIFELVAATPRAAAIDVFKTVGALAVRPIGLLRLLPIDEYQREMENPARLDLCGTIEAAQILKVTPQRVVQLADENPDFPPAVAVLKRGKVWTTRGIHRFKDRRRTPGRRRASASDDATP